MSDIKTHHQSIAMAVRSTMMGAALGLFMLPLGATAEMTTVSRGALTDLHEVQDNGYMEFYQHPDLGSFEFKSIYIEPVANEMLVRQIYDQRFRPVQIDALAEDFYNRLQTAFEATGRLTDTPDENTLVISTSLVFVTELIQESTGSHIEGASATDRTRGSTIIEMTWHAGPGGQMVAAIRDGRAPHNYAPVGDFDDRFTDSRDAFDLWAGEFAAMFGASPQVATN